MLSIYRGRLAPSPTGYLHLGHARTFWVAWQRARATLLHQGARQQPQSGTLIFRNEDLDQQRCRPEFVQAMYEDLRWLGLDWDEGPDMGGAYAPYEQSRRRSFYLAAWRKLRDGGFIYPCTCSRKDLERALSAPHEEEADDTGVDSRAVAGASQRAANNNDDDKLRYPGTCRGKITEAGNWDSPAGVSWRFKVPDGSPVAFTDLYSGAQSYIAGSDFSDFLIWRRDDIPAYQLAVVVDDAAMQITEVVRGADLLKSTARQLLLMRALGCALPQYFHCPLMRDEKNVRLAKRHDALSLRTLRAQGVKPEELRRRFANEVEWDRGLARD